MKATLCGLLAAAAILSGGCREGSSGSGGEGGESTVEAPPPLPPGTVELRLKWEAGKRYVIEHVTVSTSEMRLPGAEDALQTVSDLLQTIHNDVAAHEKGAAVTTRMDRLKMQTKAGPMTIDFDSSDPAKSGGLLGPMLKPVAEVTFTTIFDKAGEIVAIEGLEEIKGAAQFGFSKGQFELMARQSALLLPGKPVKPGDRWEALMHLPMEPLSDVPIPLKLNLKLESVEESDGARMALVSLTGEIEGDIKDAGEAVLKMKANEITGAMKFDLELGQPVETTTEMDLEMGLPKGVVAQAGAAGRIPMKLKSSSRLVKVEDLED